MASVAHLLWEAKQFYGSVPSVAGHAKVGGSNPRRTSYAPLAVVRAEIYLELVLTEILGVGKRPHLGHHLYPHLGQPGADIGRAVGSVLHSSSSGSSPTDCRCLPMRSVTASASYSLAGRTSTRVISSLSGSSATWNCIPPRCGAGFYGQHASADRPRSRPDPWAPTDAAEGQGPPLALATSLLRYFAARSWADVPAASVRGAEEDLTLRHRRRSSPATPTPRSPRATHLRDPPTKVRLCYLGQPLSGGRREPPRRSSLCPVSRELGGPGTTRASRRAALRSPPCTPAPSEACGCRSG